MMKRSLLGGVLILLGANPALADPPSTWAEQKCALYTTAWESLRDWPRIADLGPAFVETHAAFLASGCTTHRTICPRSPAEVEVADLLTTMAVSEGMAGSFLPFTCRE